MLPEVMTKAVRLVPQKARRDFLVSPRAPSYLWGGECQQQSLRDTPGAGVNQCEQG